jgi:hypothetical protein
VDSAGDLDALVAAIRGATLYRLRAGCQGRFPSRLAAGRELAAALAIAAQGIEEAAAPSMPDWRVLPVLPDLAIGDQVAVTAHDYRAALVAGLAQATAVWTPSGRVELERLRADVQALVEDVAALW